MSESNDADAHQVGACVRLKVAGIEVAAKHGVYPEERHLGNRFRVDVELDGDFEHAVQSDNITDTVDVDQIVATVRKISRQHRYNLIESLADAIAHALLASDPKVEQAFVRVSKLTLHRLENVASTAAEVTRRRP